MRISWLSFKASFLSCLLLQALWMGRVADPNEMEPNTVAIRKVVEKAGKDPRVNASLLTIGDGTMLAFKVWSLVCLLLLIFFDQMNIISVIVLILMYWFEDMKLKCLVAHKLVADAFLGMHIDSVLFRGLFRGARASSVKHCPKWLGKLSVGCHTLRTSQVVASDTVPGLI